jgi:hypothetical protein
MKKILLTSAGIGIVAFLVTGMPVFSIGAFVVEYIVLQGFAGRKA